MTVTHRKRQHQPEEIQTVNEPGLQIQCDSCNCDLTHSIRIKCADPVCEPGDGVDICPSCLCAGKEFAKHRRNHPYRVVELHSYPIFAEDWGADEELLLIEGVSLQGLGNWQAIAEHVGTRTKEEVEQHYKLVYIDSVDWPLPRMNLDFNVDPEEFQDRKRRRILSMNTNPPPGPKVAPTSAPGVHEISTFLPGRLEFEHELDNEAEDLVKDLEFGVCLEWGGDQLPEDENDVDVKARARLKEELKMRELMPTGKRPPNGMINSVMNGFSNGGTPTPTPKPDASSSQPDENKDGEDADEEPTQPPPIETKESLEFKLSLLEMYKFRIDKRQQNKGLMFDRGLLNYKQMQANEKKRPKDEKDIAHRLRPFAQLQTADDYEAFVADTIWEAVLRKKIQELQHYRRMGLVSAADIEKYEVDVAKRTQVKSTYARDGHAVERLRAGSGRQSMGPDSRRESEAPHREGTPKTGSASQGPGGIGPAGRKMPAPLNLANSPSLHLLTPEEQTLCSQLRILPKPYLVIKETLIREYARRGGKLRRREARDLVKIDVNKTSRVWDFLVQAGFMKVGNATDTQLLNGAHDPNRVSATPSLSASPSKESQLQLTPKPSFATVPALSAGFPTPTSSYSTLSAAASGRPS